MASCVIAPKLTKLCNYCIKEGTFPDILKIAKVKPIYKKGPKDICENYRPLPLLSIFSKIFEKCIHHTLTQYLEKKKLLNVNQYGFKPNFSTSSDGLDKPFCTKAITIIDNVKKALGDTHNR